MYGFESDRLGRRRETREPSVTDVGVARAAAQAPNGAARNEANGLAKANPARTAPAREP